MAGILPESKMRDKELFETEDGSIRHAYYSKVCRMESSFLRRRYKIDRIMNKIDSFVLMN